MTRIELVDRIIKIPANKETLVNHDDNPETVIVRIPRYLLTDKIENSQVFLLARVGKETVITKALEILFEEDEFVNYKWVISREYTSQDSLTIQFKIVRAVEDTPSVDAPDDIEPANPEKPSEDGDENIGVRPPDEGIEEGGPVAQLEGVDEDSEGEKIDKPQEDLGDIDPDMMVGYGENSEGVWHSYQNTFKIEKIIQQIL